MDKQYWTKKLKVLKIASKLKLTDTALMNILQQIAADKVDECEKAIREYHDYIDNADDAIAAIRSAGGE